LTTNGFYLPRLAGGLAKAGLNRVNISLDTLRADRFARIARRGDLGSVLEGLNAAEAAGLRPIKINCVVLRGYNEDEAIDFAKLTLERDWHVR
ncbi:radical SAM protein, partial [Streptococcus suis]